MAERRFITTEEAIGILPDGDLIHTFVNVSFGLVGADWEREELIDKIRSSDYREITGPQARGMNHGLVLYNEIVMRQSDILFVETDAERLDALDPPEENEKEN